MDHRFSEHGVGVAMKSTRELVWSKPACSKINCMDREGSFAAWAKNHGSLRAKIFETVKQKLSNGAKIIQLGSQSKIFRKNFSIKGEKLLQASQCSLYTTAGAISGLIFVSTERVAFCSDRSIKTYSTTGKLLKFRYKVLIPLAKIKGVQESKNTKSPSKNYLELVTVDDFNFWFTGFVHSNKILRCIHHAISMNCLSI